MKIELSSILMNFRIHQLVRNIEKHSMSFDPIYTLRFPIGEFSMPSVVPDQLREKWIQTISDFPSTMKELTGNLTIEQKNQTYRPEGWSIKQVVHH